MDGVVINVLHFIVGLNVGGAEMMLKRLIVSQQVNPNYRHSVISLTHVGKVGAQLQEIGVEVRAMGMRSPLDIFRVLWQMMQIIRIERPDIVQTWMYHADLLGGLAARLAGNRHVIWGVHSTGIPQIGLSATGIVLKFCSWLSHFLPSAIACCGESARTFHAEKGYDQKKLVVIPNGYDLTRFNGNPLNRRQVRAAFGFGDNDVVVGIVGRFDPLKDYKNFILAATSVASKINNVKFLMVGRGIDSKNIQLKGWLDVSGFAERFALAGERNDIPECLAAMDLFCLSSSKEGFPNVVCEAMAMKIPCVVTDVGDASEIVFDTGIVVPPRDSIALAEALQTMISNGAAERSCLGILARLRIEKNYSIEIASSRYENLYNQVSEN